MVFKFKRLLLADKMSELKPFFFFFFIDFKAGIVYVSVLQTPN